MALAIYQMHKNLGKLDEAVIEALLRYGFVLRAWEESLGIAPDSENVDAPQAVSPLPGVPDQQPDGAVLDPETWVKDAATVATNPYGQFAEVPLELSTIELLGIQRIVDRYMGTPWQGYDPRSKLAFRTRGSATHCATERHNSSGAMGRSGTETRLLPLRLNGSRTAASSQPLFTA